MIILRDTEAISTVPDPALRQLIELRISQINECCPWDAEELGPMIVIEPGDSANDLEAVMGFSILEGIFDESHFGDEEFSPCFEFAESHGDHLFELGYIVSDGGYGYEIFIPNRPGIDPVLLSFCKTYAVPTPQ